LIISNGTTLVNNTTGSGTGSGGISIVSGTLGGTGAVTGPVTFSAGTLSPGAGGIGTFTINGALTLAGNTIIEVNKGVGNDRVVATSVNFAGTLTIATNGTPFVAGDTFQIFSLSGHTADFGTISGNPGAGLNWAFNPTNGVLSVVSAVVPSPTLVFTNTGGSLQFSWTGSFKLQSQTNNLATGLTGTWGDYPGGGTSPVTVSTDPASPTVFFRLVSTP
jgi:hypothetical protein